jgi:hypothetical protein
MRGGQTSLGGGLTVYGRRGAMSPAVVHRGGLSGLVAVGPLAPSQRLSVFAFRHHEPKSILRPSSHGCPSWSP